MFSRLTQSISLGSALLLLASAPGAAFAETQKCTPELPGGETSVEITVGTWYSLYPSPAAATLTQQADLFTTPSWDGKDLGYGIADESVQAFYWAVDSDCALWYQVLVSETTGWTPAYNVEFVGGIRHH